MPLPNLFAAQSSVAPPARRRRAVSHVAGQIADLGLSMEPQQQDNWCWAAVGVSVKKFLGAATIQQCEQANLQLRRQSCCSDPEGCNLSWILDPAVFPPSAGAMPFDTVKQVIDGHRPIAVRIAWSGGGYHFVCSDGYNSSGTAPVVAVKDPWLGASSVPYDVLASSYQGIGSWSDSYRT